QLANAFFERSDTTERTREGDTDPLAVVGNVQPGIHLGLPRGSDGQMRAAIHSPRGLPIDVRLDLEPLDLAGEPRGLIGRVETGDLRRAATPRQQRLPRLADGVADRADHPET